MHWSALRYEPPCDTSKVLLVLVNEARDCAPSRPPPLSIPAINPTAPEQTALVGQAPRNILRGPQKTVAMSLPPGLAAWQTGRPQTLQSYKKGSPQSFDRFQNSGQCMSLRAAPEFRTSRAPDTSGWHSLQKLFLQGNSVRR